MTDEPKMQPEVKMQAEVQSDVRKNPRRIAFILRRSSPYVKTQDDGRVMTYPNGAGALHYCPGNCVRAAGMDFTAGQCAAGRHC